MGIKNTQQGMATLIVTVIILLVITLMAAFAARVGVFDQRMAGNESRYNEAFTTAEAGLDYATQNFAAQFVAMFDGSDETSMTLTEAQILAASQVTIPTKPDGSQTDEDSGESYFTVVVSDSGSDYNGIPIYTFVSTGVSADGTGTATVQRQMGMASVLGGGTPDVPVAVGGSIGTGGNFNIVTNPNGGGPGVPVSVWSDGDITIQSGSAATCQPEYYGGHGTSACSNPNGELLSGGVTDTYVSATDAQADGVYDLLPNDPNFPDDLFQYLFGIPSSDWGSKENDAAAHGQSVTNCDAIVTAGVNAGTSYPLWWVNGDCDLSRGTVIVGSDTDPVIIIISDGELKMGANTEVYGIVYLFDNPSGDASEVPSASMTGAATVFGAFVSDVGDAHMSGTYSVVYDETTLESLTDSGNSYSPAYIPGSWRDFQ